MSVSEKKVVGDLLFKRLFIVKFSENDKGAYNIGFFLSAGQNDPFPSWSTNSQFYPD